MHSTSLVRALWCAVTLACLTISGASAVGLQRSVQVEPAGEHEMLIATPNASSGSCGVERWSVKVGTDPDASLVSLTSTTSQTISYLRGITAPATPPLNARVQPTEITDFVIDATLVEYKLENDSDYHLVIKDAAGNTMIAEIPDPACVSGGPFANLIKSTRQQFDSKYSATTSFQTANIPVRLTGVAFFDFQHGQTGVAPNGIELHPLLNVVFNPGAGTPDFGLSVAPGSASVIQGASTTTTVTVVPQNGFNSSVTFAAAGLPAGVTASFSPASTTGSTTLTLTTSATAATGPATISIAGSTGSLTHTTSVALTVNAAGGGGGGTTAVYNSTLKAPWCASVGASCDSGPTLLLGRGTMTGGTEPNHPNTITTCTDGNSGTFHSDESNDRLMIASTDGGPLTAGKVARITATVWAYSASSNALDLYSAPNANSPTWTFLNTIVPSGTGAQTLTTTFALPTGGLQAIRAHFRSGGTATPCSTGAYDDSDDLVFAVSSTAPAPDFSFGASPTTVTMNPGASGTSTVTVASLNGFSAATSLTASGLPSGVTAAFSPTPVTPIGGSSATSVLTLTASASVPAGTYNATINGTSGSLSHSATVNLTITVPSGPAQLLVNPGFETGTASPWTMSTGTLCSNSSCSGEVARSGTWFDWLNGYGSAHTDTLSQTVAIPAGKTSAMLQFYMHIDTLETTTTTANDTLTVGVYNTSGTLLGTLNTYSNLNANTGYSVHNLTMTPYIGQTVVVKFTGVENASKQTSFVIDDVNLNVQ